MPPGTASPSSWAPRPTAPAHPTPATAPSPRSIHTAPAPPRTPPRLPDCAAPIPHPKPPHPPDPPPPPAQTAPPRPAPSIRPSSRSPTPAPEYTGDSPAQPPFPTPSTTYRNLPPPLPPLHATIGSWAWPGPGQHPASLPHPRPPPQTNFLTKRTQSLVANQQLVKTANPILPTLFARHHPPPPQSHPSSPLRRPLPLTTHLTLPRTVAYLDISATQGSLARAHGSTGDTGQRTDPYRPPA